MRTLRSGGWVLLVYLAAPAAAQDAGPFDELVGLIEPGDDVRVTFSDGRQSRVRVTSLTAGTLSVHDGGRTLDLGEADVWSVRYRVRDSIRESFWLGFGAGAAWRGGMARHAPRHVVASVTGLRARGWPVRGDRRFHRRLRGPSD